MHAKCIKKISDYRCNTLDMHADNGMKNETSIEIEDPWWVWIASA